MGASTGSFEGSVIKDVFYSELTKTSTALPHLAVLSVLSVARRLVLIFVNPLYIHVEKLSGSLKGYLKVYCFISAKLCGYSISKRSIR